MGWGQVQKRDNATIALERLVAALDDRIVHSGMGDGRPWVPPHSFQDGVLEAAIERGREVLRGRQGIRPETVDTPRRFGDG